MVRFLILTSFLFVAMPANAQKVLSIADTLKNSQSKELITQPSVNHKEEGKKKSASKDLIDSLKESDHAALECPNGVRVHCIDHTTTYAEESQCFRENFSHLYDAQSCVDNTETWQEEAECFRNISDDGSDHRSISCPEGLRAHCIEHTPTYEFESQCFRQNFGYLTDAQVCISSPTWQEEAECFRNLTVGLADEHLAQFCPLGARNHCIDHTPTYEEESYCFRDNFGHVDGALSCINNTETWQEEAECFRAITN